jgi:outer membrane protein
MHLTHMTIGRSLAALTLACMLTTMGWAQASPDAPQPQVSRSPMSQPRPFQLMNYSKPISHFPNPIGPYTARHVAENDLTNSPRVQDLIHDGKLMLSMDDAVALALENNLDIAIARYNMNIADTDILRAKAGSSILGGNFGVVLNTPGGNLGGLSSTVGTGPGGTSLGSGGAGAGAGGLVGSTLGSGPLISSFDPILTGTFSEDHLNQRSSSAFTGVPELAQNTGTYDLSYNQGFQSGTNLLVGFNNSRVTTNQPFSTLSPQLTSNFKFQLTQHILQGFGFAPNRRFLRIAQNNREISDVTFRLQIIDTVDQIENMYWDLVFAYENVRVQKETLAFAEKTLSDNKKQVEIGTLAPIEVVRAQSTVATDRQAVTVAETNLQLQQLLIKNALTRNLQDPKLADAEVVPTSTMMLPAEEPVVPVQDLINDGLGHRAELAEARINLTNSEISKKAVISALRPTLDAFAYYGGSGLGGSLNPHATICSAPGQNFCVPPTQIPPPVSYASNLNQLVDSTAPDKGVGLTLNIPLRNRAAQALQVRSELEYRQAQLRLQQIENQVRIEVRNAQYSVQQNRAAVESAQAAVALGRQSLDAEQKKYALGASTSTLVLQNQSALATAESNLVSATANYEKSRIELDRSTGLLLDHTGILVADAQRGQVTHMPSVPYVAPRQETPSPAMPETPRP